MEKQMTLAVGMTYQEVCQQFRALWPNVILELFFDDNDYRKGNPETARLEASDTLRSARLDITVFLTDESSYHTLHLPILQTFELQLALLNKEGTSFLPNEWTLKQANESAKPPTSHL